MIKQEAVGRFVSQMQQIPGELIRAAYSDEKMFDLELLAGGTLVCNACGAHLEEMPKAGEFGERICPECDNPDDIFPQAIYAWPAGWDTLFHPVWPDDEWVRRNLEAVAACGFLIYNCQYCGILLGIDGAGYDFVEHHWMPLYDARGLRWHDKEPECEHVFITMGRITQCVHCGCKIPYQEVRG